MDQTPEMGPAADGAVPGPACAHCGVPLYQPEWATPLCPGCREQFIRYPFPLWVKLFGGVVLLLLVVALFSLPHALRVGIHYKRAETAEANRKYLTAQRELEGVVKQEPSFLPAQGRLLIAAFYNGDMKTVGTSYAQIEGKDIEDEHLYGELSRVIAEAEHSVPGESFGDFVNHHPGQLDQIPVIDYRNYLAAHTDDWYARIGLVNRLYDLHQYAACDSMLNGLLGLDPAYRLALGLKMPVKREMGQPDSSLYYADRLLAQNRETTYAYASKVRALLKQHRDKEALECARIGNAVDGKDDFMLCSLALAYHYNGDAARRDATLARVSHDSSTLSMLNGVRNIVSGKDPFRN